LPSPDYRISADRQQRIPALTSIERRRLTHCRRVGLAGSATIAVGGVLAGTLPSRDPFADLPGVRELRTSSLLSVFVVYAGLTMLLAAWWRVGGLVRRPGGPSLRELTITGVWWAAPFAFATPIFSRDVYSYLAQGAMTRAGIDAYAVGPAALGGNLAANVPEIWQHTPAPYGPVFLSLAGGVTELTTNGTWLGVLGMRALAVAGVAMLVWSVPRLARSCGVAPTAALWLGVINPLVLLHLVTDAHNDAFMLGLMSIGLVCALERRPAIGAIAVTLAALVKAPAGLAIAFLVSIWAGQLTGRARWARASVATAAVAAATTVAATALAGTGYGWIAALDTPTRAHTWLSITTDLGYFTGTAAQWLGVAGVAETTDALRLVGLAVATILCVLLWRHSAQIGPVVALGLSLAAVVMLGPVVHPWYLLWGIVPLAATARSRAIRRAVTVLSVSLVLFVLPGGVEPGISALAGAALGTVAVLAALVVLVVLVAVRARPLPDRIGRICRDAASVQA
jgi:hypothetical protein